MKDDITKLEDLLNLESLMVFAHVVREKSFSSAARKLNRPKQSIHRQLKHFEDSLSRKLLQKQNRGVVPTRVGLQLFQVAERIREEARHGLSLLRLPSPEASMLLRVAAPALLAEVFLSAIVAKFLKKHSNARVEFILSNDVFDLDGSRIDLAFRIGNFPQKIFGYRSIKIGVATRVVVASPQYVKQQGRPRTVAELARHRILHFGPLNAFSQASWHLGRKQKLDPLVGAASPRLILDLILEGAGLGMLPEMICAEHLKAKRLVKLLGDKMDLRVPVSILIKEELWGSPVVDDLVNSVLRAARTSTWLTT